MGGQERIYYIITWVLIGIAYLCTIGMVTKYSLVKNSTAYWSLVLTGASTGFIALIIVLSYI
ncbi:MAG: hypothetical protein HMLIMOIP_002664 [Candidatus Nitrosomirales archaeon]|jgi:hypothetical protein